MNDTWRYILDDTGIGEGDVIVSLSILKESGETLLNRKGKLGIRILPDDSVASVAGYLPHLTLVELYFPELADGRLFSHAWLLRNRYHYPGEIRATGDFLPDQVFYLSRVGVNSFHPENTQDLSATLAGLNDFSVNYQPSVN